MVLIFSKMLLACCVDFLRAGGMNDATLDHKMVDHASSSKRTSLKPNRAVSNAKSKTVVKRSDC